MIHRYRVLNGILALRQFTVADLARYSDVKDTTVRTVLAREARFVERAGTRSEGRRGGQSIQYRLRADAEQDLVDVLGELEELGKKVSPLVSDQEDPVILSLIAAEDVLLRQLPQASQADRAGLVELANSDYGAANLVRSDHHEAGTHRRVVELLLRLAVVEQTALEMAAVALPTVDIGARDWPVQATQVIRSEPMGGKELDALGRDLQELLQSWPQLSDRNLLPDLVTRVGGSWFGSAIFQAGRGAP
ncbi:hypothetical protein [Jidongwangia harbinensis]|uniref:hypothetical protein n=1 Tax=Jidongwangia harbinensis TaxID=2878561 RepID=UPI001CD9FA95|nr:hypothetical protein [Jidongwangia harbinensis]MCA2211314.1 hypothetical protein [Jidongwangia harbinensis]